MDEPTDEPTDKPMDEPLDGATGQPMDAQDSALRRRSELPRKLPDESFVEAEGGGPEPSLLARMARSDMLGAELESEAGERVDAPGAPTPGGRVDAGAVSDDDDPPDTDTAIEGTRDIEDEPGPR